LDLVFYAVNLASESSTSDVGNLDISQLNCTPVIKALHLSARDTVDQEFLPHLTSQHPFTNVVELFGAGLHRIPLYDQLTNTIHATVSQSDVVRYLVDNESIIASDIFKMSIEDLALGNPPCIYCTASSSVLSALKIMVVNRVLGIAVVDDQSQIVGSLSASDFKDWQTHWPHFLKEPVHKFIQTIKQNTTTAPKTTATVSSSTISSSAPSSTGSSPVSVYVTKSAAFITVLKLMTKHQVHRVWVVEDSSKAIRGVVSTTDVMALLWAMKVFAAKN